MSEKDKRPYFVLTNEYPRHPKVRALTDKGFRLHITLLGLCNEDRNDGVIGKHDLQMLGPKAGKELLDAHLVHDVGDGAYRLHDYEKHQNTRVEIEQFMNEKQMAGKAGGKASAHQRWHVKREIIDPECELCHVK